MPDKVTFVVCNMICIPCVTKHHQVRFMTPCVIQLAQHVSCIQAYLQGQV